MALTQKQQTFIDKYILDLGASRRKERKLREAYAKFADRFNEAEKSLSVLPDGHPTRAQLEPLLAIAKTKADGGAFKAAFKDLKQVQKDAALASNGYLSWITSSTLAGEIKQAEDVLDEVVRATDRALSRLDSFVPAMARLRAVSECDSISEAVQYRKAFAQQEAILRTDFDARINRVNEAAQLVDTRRLPDLVAEIKRKIKLVNDDGRGHEIQAEIGRLNQLETAVGAKGGLYTKNTLVYAPRDPARVAFEKRLAELKSFRSFQTKETAETISMDEVFAMYGLVAMEHDLTHATEMGDDKHVHSVMDRLQAEEEARLEAARQRYLEDKKRDEDIAGDDDMGRSYDPEVAEELETFDTAAILDGPLGPPLPLDADPGEIQRRAAQVKQSIEGFINTCAKDDEGLLDLVVKGKKQLFETMANAAGIPTDPKQCQPGHLALVEELVKAAHEAIIANAPNQMAADGQTMTMNGVTWELETVLSSGANGTAKRFIDRDTGKTIVVKTPLFDDDEDEDIIEEARAGMADEVLIHARLLKGDITEAKSTMIGLEGAAIGPDGMVHLILEDAKGGDLSNVANKMNVMVETGVLPPEARQVLAQDLIRQAVNGLRYMEEQNAIHNDLKPGNILMMDDGTVKITDFGESRFADEEGEHSSAKVERYGTTAKYEAPEQFGSDTVTSGVDTFALGGIIQALMGTTGENTVANDWKFTSPSHKTGGEPLTAMDRVVEGTLQSNPDERPSLDAIAASSLLSTEVAARDYNQADIDELKRRSAEYQQAMSVVRVVLPKDYLAGETAGSKSLSKMQNSIGFYEQEVVRVQKKLDQEIAAGRDITSAKADLEKYMDAVQKARKLRDDAIHAARTAGKENLDATLKDPKVMIVFQGASLSAPQASSIVEQASERAETVKREYYAYQHEMKAKIKDVANRVDELGDFDIEGFIELSDEREKLVSELNKRVDETNERLIGYRDTIDTIGQLLRESAKEHLSPEGVLALAGEALKEVSSRFGRPILRMSPPPLPAPGQQRGPRPGGPVIGSGRPQPIPEAPEPPPWSKAEDETQEDEVVEEGDEKVDL